MILFVTSLLVSKDSHFPIGLRLYKKYKEEDPTFKTKLQLAIELVKEAYSKGVNFSCVIFDAWYLSSEVIKVIKELKKYWISPLKSNRIVLKNNKRISLKEYISNIDKSSFKKKKIKDKYYYYYSETVKISKLGKILLVALITIPTKSICAGSVMPSANFLCASDQTTITTFTFLNASLYILACSSSSRIWFC